MNVLILYTSLEGQTKKIAARMAETLSNQSYQVTMQPVDHLSSDFALVSYDAAILGGPIHMGKYPKSLKQFVKQHLHWLNNHPSAFFTVCMAINSQRPESRQDAVNYGKKFLQTTRWQPTYKATFAGAVKYTQYGIITRLIMKMIAKHEGGSTDTSQDHEYTDWRAVEHFTREFAENLTELQES